MENHNFQDQKHKRATSVGCATYSKAMPMQKNKEGGKGRPWKGKNHGRTAQEAIQCMFAALTVKDTHAAMELSELTNDASENISDMDIEEQKKWVQAPKEPGTVTKLQDNSETKDQSSPERKKLVMRKHLLGFSQRHCSIQWQR